MKKMTSTENLPQNDSSLVLAFYPLFQFIQYFYKGCEQFFFLVLLVVKCIDKNERNIFKILFTTRPGKKWLNKRRITLCYFVDDYLQPVVVHARKDE